MTRSIAPRDITAIIPAGITFLAVVGLVGIARVYERLPVQAPDCKFKTVLGIPCLSCGGTRSMQALALGNVGEALTLNPAVVLGVTASVIWLVIGLLRYRNGFTRPTPQASTKRIKIVGTTVAALLAANWIYLLATLE